MVRGRPAGRLDWRAAIEEAELPEALAALARDTISHTRLPRREKATAARALVERLNEELLSGYEPGEIVDDFGGPRLAALEIRREHLRHRPWFRRARSVIRRRLGFALLTIAALYAVFAVRFYTGAPTVTRNYTAEYNATVLATPEADLAWPLYRDATIRLETLPQELEISDWPDLRPGDERWDAAVAYVERNRESFDLARAGAARATMGYLLTDAVDPDLAARSRPNELQPGTPMFGTHSTAATPNPPLMQVVIGHLGAIRELARCLTFDARLAATAGDAERAAANLDTIFAMADQIREHPILIVEIVSLAVFGTAVQATGEVLALHPELLTDEHLQALAARVRGFAGGGRLMPSMDDHRATIDDFFQRFFTDDGNGDGRVTAAGMAWLNGMQRGGPPSATMLDRILMPAGAAWFGGRKELQDEFESLLRGFETAAAEPFASYNPAPFFDRLDARQAAPPKPGHRMLYVLFPALKKVYQVGEQATQRRDAALVTIALAQHRRRTGVYPADLSELGPDPLPADRYDGTPIKYRLIDGNPVLYSVGVDRDDDGGRPCGGSSPEWDAANWLPTAELTERLHDPGQSARYDGDWILWPPYPPERPEIENEPDQADEQP